MSEHFGFVGVGRMGGPMASRLLDAGHKLTIFDISEATTAVHGPSQEFHQPTCKHGEGGGQEARLVASW